MIAFRRLKIRENETDRVWFIRIHEYVSRNEAVNRTVNSITSSENNWRMMEVYFSCINERHLSDTSARSQEIRQ